MDSTTYTSLTGLTAPTAYDFDTVAAAVQANLEAMLGYPLDPDDWDNQYIETGKTSNECACPDVVTLDTDNLLPADDVVNAYRLYTWRPSDPYIAIDPATAVHAVKLVRGGVTYQTFEPSTYALRLVNDEVSWGKYLAYFNWASLVCGCGCNHWATNHMYQLAVDADWAFDEVPSQITEAFASLLTARFDPKDGIKSESITNHSYTKFDKQPLSVTYADLLAKYGGPNGQKVSLV